MMPPAAAPGGRRAPSAATEYELVMEDTPSPAPGSPPPTESPPLTPAEVGLADDDARDIYRLMVLTRVLDERMWTLNRQGKAPFVTPARGHEALQVASARALRVGVDWVVTYYRDWGVALALGLRPY